MTLLVSWLGVDSRGPASAYITSDSRVSWRKGVFYDFARKTFSMENHPDIFGYSGDVLFPLMSLSQIIDIANKGLLFKDKMTAREKSQIIITKLILAFKEYPSEDPGVTTGVINILHISRDDLNNSFYAAIIKWNLKKGWTLEVLDLPEKSDILIVCGSGKTEFESNYELYQIGDNKSTSRNVFHCFTDTLFNIKSQTCGGAPQLVGLYRKPNSGGIDFGIIRNSKRYLYGTQVDNLSNFNSIEWRNDLFELCDGCSKTKFKDAMSQPNKLKRY